MAKKAAGDGMTPAIVALNRAATVFEIVSYEHVPGSAPYGLEAAEALGLEPDEVFKTLVVAVDGLDSPGSLAVAVIPVAESLDLKAFAMALGAKRAELADPAVAQRRTGYVVGGISPIGQKVALPTVIDETVELLDDVHVSAGRRGLEVRLAPSDLVAVTQARVSAITRP